MQPVATALFNVLEQGINSNPADPVRDLTWLFEFYEPDVLPGADGFDPADASECFAGIEITWLGQAYRRVVLGASDIQIKGGKDASSCTIRLSNADENRYAATWATQNQVEGMRLVIRLISRTASTTLATSTIRFVGRCDKPDGFDVIQGSIKASASISTIDYEWPPKTYQADDPEGRSPADPLYEGFPHVVLNGTFTHKRPEPDKSFNKWDMRRYVATLPWSSYDDTPLGEPIPLVLGRTQLRAWRGVFADTGRVTTCIDFACMGPIADILNFRMDNPPEYQQFFTQPENVTKHLGEAGGTGTQIADPLWPNHPLFSHTAYVGYNFRYIGTGAFSQIDAGHDTVMIVLGMVVPLPDGSGVFNTEGWTDNGAYLARFLITDERFLNLNPAFVEDSACFATGQDNDRPTVDDSNAEEILIPDVEINEAGSSFLRFRSTGLIDVRRARHFLGLGPDMPESLDVTDFVDFDINDPPTLLTDVRRLRKKFTTNVLLRKRVKGLDFFYGPVLTSFRGYLPWNWKGKLEIRSERPADFAHLRDAVAPTATTILIEDVTSWKASGGLWGKVLVGAGLTTSEARKASSAAYTTDANGITLVAAATGTVTATASGATLSGGSSSAQATGTITIGGTAQALAQVSATIQGIQVAHTLSADDTLATAAYMLAQHINANTQLRRFVSASASGAVVTVTSKWGVLTLSTALANSHTGPVANPTTAPAGVTASGSGASLSPGVWRIAYANRNARGSTYRTPHSSVTVAAGQQINIPALAFPVGVTSRDWFMSKAVGDSEMVLHTNDTTALGFAITAPPSSTAAFPPEYNTTGEEAMRVALSFASNNQTAAILAQAGLARGNVFEGSYKWPNAKDQPTYTEAVGNYIDAADDFVASKVIINDKALRERIGKTNPKDIDLTAVDSWPQARRLTYYDFSKFIDHHWFNTLGSNGVALLLEEGDVICSSDDSGGHVNVTTRVEEFNIRLDDFTVSITRARLYSSRMFLELVPKTQPLLPSVLQWVATRQTLFEMLDMPPVWEEHADTPGFYALFTYDEAVLGQWSGVNFWGNYGSGNVKIAETDFASTMGTATTALSAGSKSGLETGTTLRVVLKKGTLSSIDEEQAAANAKANLAVYGNEYIQFLDATLFDAATNTWDISTFYRGRFGTKAYAHSTDERFALMEGALFVPIDVSRLDKEYTYTAQTVDQDVSAGTTKLFTWTGGTIKKLAPSGEKRSDDSAGNSLVEFYHTKFGQGLHRGRTGFDPAPPKKFEFEATDSSFVPLNPPLVIPVTVGEEQRAVMESYSTGVDWTGKFSAVSINTVTLSGSALHRRVRALQQIREAGNYVEAALKASDADAYLFLLSPGKDWRTVAVADFDYAFVLSQGGLGATLKVYDHGDEIYSEDASAYYSTGQRVRLDLIGSRVVFSMWVDERLEELAASVIPPSYPLTVGGDLSLGSAGSASIRKLILTTNPDPKAILTAEQKAEFGIGSPVYANIYAIDERIGRGYALEATLEDSLA